MKSPIPEKLRTKKCLKCGIEKSALEFNKSGGNKDGLHSYCKACMRVYSKKYNALHRDKNKAYCKNYRAIHKAEGNAYSRKYHADNRDECNARHKKYHATHSEEINARQRAYKNKHPERIKAKSAVYNSIAAGKMIRPKECSNPFCDCIEGITGHHWSYLEEHWLDVIWSCYGCHKRIRITGQDKIKDIDWGIVTPELVDRIPKMLGEGR